MMNPQKQITTNAPSIRYEGDLRPEQAGIMQKHAQAMQQMQQQAMMQQQQQQGMMQPQMGQPQMPQPQMGQPQMPQPQMGQLPGRMPAAYGGIMGMDGRKQYGIGSWFQKKIMDPIKKVIPKELKNPATLATLTGLGLNQFGVPFTGTPGDRMGQDWFSDLISGAGDKAIQQEVGRPLGFAPTTDEPLDIEEGIKSGGDVEASADRLGKWFKGINPNAKPGKEGYMRKRNVPPTDPDHPGSKYDATKHKPQEEGKPLEYMKPQHKDYAVGNIRKTIGKVATRKAERDTPKRGNIHQLAKSKKATFSTETEKGQDTLKKHGVPNPSLKDMYAKWMRGNSPQSKKNPEGYVRSDRK